MHASTSLQLAHRHVTHQPEHVCTPNLRQSGRGCSYKCAGNPSSSLNSVEEPHARIAIVSKPSQHSPPAVAEADAAAPCSPKPSGTYTWSNALQHAQRLQPLLPDYVDQTAGYSPNAASDLERQWLLAPHDWAQHSLLLSGCEPEHAPLRVAMLLSGGIDSSVALRLAQAAGHDVTAFYLQIWFVEDFRNTWDSCPWEADMSFCQQVCEQAHVPLEVVPLSEEYWARVVSHSIAEVRAGRTPNPDVLCNSRVKFGAFMEHLNSTYPGRFDRIATGHYAAVSHNEGGVAQLSCTRDAVKDQTYFLAHLSQVQLARCMFPLGPLTKPAVRQLARAASLATQSRPDSQGICFLGKVQYNDFVREHLGEWPGPLIDAETNHIRGFHSGFWFHTIGQRKGVPLSGGPWYVVAKDADKNAIYISRKRGAPIHVRNRFRCGPFNWLAGVAPATSQGLSRCKIRHGPDAYSCTVNFEACSAPIFSASPSSSTAMHISDDSTGDPVRGDQSVLDPQTSPDVRQTSVIASSGVVIAGGGTSGRDSASNSVCSASCATVELEGELQAISPGQYAVFYDGDICVGSAVIIETLDSTTSPPNEHIPNLERRS